MKAFLRTMAQVRHVAEADRLDAVLQQAGPALLIMDLRAKECRDLIDQVQKEWPEILIIALGIVKSDPLREAEKFGIYAAEDLELDRRRFQTLVGRAFDYLKVLQETESCAKHRQVSQLWNRYPEPAQCPPRRAAGHRYDCCVSRACFASSTMSMHFSPVLWKASRMPPA